MGQTKDDDSKSDSMNKSEAFEFTTEGGVVVELRISRSLHPLGHGDDRSAAGYRVKGQGG